MRTALLVLLAFVAVTAIPSGLILMIRPTDAFGMTTELLEKTPFPNFFWPGLILAAVVGGIHATAFAFLMLQKEHFLRWTLLAGLSIAGWILVQIFLIREFFWLQWVYLLAGFFTLLMGLQLKHKELI
jgi:hypothetical protein